jgi:membrane protease YdiL (CAAX protease family)
MFSPWTAHLANFWLVMTLATGVLAGAALLTDRGRLREAYAFRPVHVLIGALSAAQLYLIFWLGNWIAVRLTDFARPQVVGIYATREQAAPWLIGLLLLLWIGPAEEIFWRGFIQRRLAARIGPLLGWLIAGAIYALVHVWALNLMLLLAAALCGLYWGAMYLRYRSVWPSLISHALWDVAVFVLWPIGG